MLRLHRAERSSTLASALAAILAVPLADPFATEIISVPAKGVERWLNQRLSAVLGAVTTDGIAANIAFPTPTRLVDDALSAAGGRRPDDDPWAPSRVLWTLFGVIDDSLGEAWNAVLAKHLGRGREDHRVGRRYATAAHLAELFRQYGAQRPKLLADWTQGHDTDGAGGRLDDDLGWQAELWRRLRERIGEPSPAERLEPVCQRLAAEPALVDLPERFALFGPTRLTTVQLAVITALAVHRDVHLFLPHPSPAMWTRLAVAAGTVRRADDDSATLVGHPLLASLARDVRELQQRLQSLGAGDARHDSDDSDDSDTLLARVQADIRADRAPTLVTDGDSPVAARPDGTIEVHACHGPARQVEVLRESLLHLFQRDPTLQPRDVLVMCPDVEAYAPLIRAAFGQGTLGHPGHRLRVRLADRALRQTNPLLDIVAALLALADGRVTASDALDLAASAPVRRRFGFSDEHLERLRDWTAAAGVRWGIGQRQRAGFGLGELQQNTWNTGLDRVLLGVTADETDLAWLGLALPLDDVDGNDIALAGRFAEYIDRLAAVLSRLQGTQPAPTWTGALSRALDLLTEVSPSDAWQLAQARRELAAATEHSQDVALRLPDVRAMLSDRLAGRPTRANFRTGELTVCTMVPMRSVPHRVVVLLGLDDEVFPRSGGIDGDDVLMRNPCIGERDPRSEDRQLLLDAVLSAGERLVVLYTGADPVTGALRPPAIPVSELLDVITATVGSHAMSQVVRRHAVQPFDPRNFEATAPFSFDRAALAGARAAQGSRVAVPAFLSHPLPVRAADVNLRELIAFLVHPTQAFLRQRLGFRVPQEDDDIVDALHAELDGLAKWDVGDRMLAARLAGVSVEDFRQAEWRRGTLPPRRLGQRLLGDIEQAVEALAVVSIPVHAGPPETIDVDIDIGGGRRLTGTVTGVYGNVIASTSYSTLAPKHRISGWANLLAAAAARAAPWQGVTTGRGSGRRPAWRSTLVAPDDAVEQLSRLVDLRDRGLVAPLPMAVGATCVYAERRRSGSSAADALDAATADWDGRFGEGKDPQVAYVYGTPARLAQLCMQPPHDDERAWFDDPTRFGVLARRLWTPLLSAESMGSP